MLADKIGPVASTISDLNKKLETNDRKIAVLEEKMEHLEMCAIEQNSMQVVAILVSMESLYRVTVKILLRKYGMDPVCVTNEYIPLKSLILY